MKNRSRVLMVMVVFMGGMILSCGGDNATGPKANVAPKIASITASAAKATYKSVVSLTANASDENKDVLSYVWRCTGGTFSTASTSDSGRRAVTSSKTISWKAPVRKGTCQISVTVSDKSDSVSSSLDLEVVGLFWEDFSNGASSWESEHCFSSLINGHLQMTVSGAGSDDPWGGVCRQLPVAVPIPYRVTVKTAWVTTVPNDYGIGPYLYVKDSDNPPYSKFGIIMQPSGTSYNFVIVNTPMTVPTFNQNDYNPLASGKSNYVPKQANSWVEVTLSVSAEKNLDVSLDGRSIGGYDIKNIESQIGRTIDLTLTNVGFDMHTGTALLDDIIVDVVDPSSIPIP